MRIEWRDLRRRRIGRVDVDPAARPTRVPVVERGVHAPEREVFLQWEGALDDAGQLRKCLACGSNDLFKEKAFPQVTGLVIVMAFMGAIVGALGLATNLPVLLLLLAVLVLDVAILVFSRRRLVCYQCRSSYHELPIARYHRSWDRAVADRYPSPAASTDEPELAGGGKVAGKAAAGSGSDSETSTAPSPASKPGVVLVGGEFASANARDVMDTKSYFQ